MLWKKMMRIPVEGPMMPYVGPGDSALQTHEQEWEITKNCENKENERNTEEAKVSREREGTQLMVLGFRIRFFPAGEESHRGQQRQQLLQTRSRIRNPSRPAPGGGARPGVTFFKVQDCSVTACACV